MPDAADAVLLRLTELAAARFGERARHLAPDADLFEALGIDSLQALDLLTDLEEAFGVEIPDYELQGANTLGALGISLAAGQFVLPGSQTAAVPVAPGDVFTATFAGIGSVTTRFTSDSPTTAQGES